MPYYEFFWTDELVEHVAENGVSTEECEEVVCNPASTAKSHSSGLPAVFGYTPDGRYLIAIYEMLDNMTVLPVTAYEVDEPA